MSTSTPVKTSASTSSAAESEAVCVRRRALEQELVSKVNEGRADDAKAVVDKLCALNSAQSADQITEAAVAELKAVDSQVQADFANSFCTAVCKDLCKIDQLTKPQFDMCDRQCEARIAKLRKFEMQVEQKLSVIDAIEKKGVSKSAEAVRKAQVTQSLKTLARLEEVAEDTKAFRRLLLLCHKCQLFSEPA